MSKTMKAYVRTAADTQEVILTNMPVPEPGPEEVLVKVAAFGVGIHDRYFIPGDVTFPYVIGSEGAGVISKLGSGVTGFSKGDRVIFTTVLQQKGGSWAEYAVAPVTSLISLPENMGFEQAATVPIAGKTALECLRELNLKAGNTLFIAGASGAIGTLIIQMAIAKGIRVIASASESNQAYMQELGAEKTVDYRDPQWIEQVKAWSDGGVDAALAIQPGTGADSIQVVKENGLLITVSGDSQLVTPQRNIVIRQMGHATDPKQLKDLAVDMANGKISVTIEKEYSFTEALEALKKTETRHARGKVVVSVNS